MGNQRRKKKSKLASTDGIKIHCFIQPQVHYVTRELNPNKAKVLVKNFDLYLISRSFKSFAATLTIKDNKFNEHDKVMSQFSIDFQIIKTINK